MSTGSIGVFDCEDMGGRAGRRKTRVVPLARTSAAARRSLPRTHSSGSEGRAACRTDRSAARTPSECNDVAQILHSARIVSMLPRPVPSCALTSGGSWRRLGLQDIQDRPIDGRTDRQTDRPTDRRSNWHMNRRQAQGRQRRTATKPCSAYENGCPGCANPAIAACAAALAPAWLAATVSCPKP